MLNAFIKKISHHSMGLLPTSKSVWQAIFSIMVIALSMWLLIHTINSSKPVKPDTSNQQFNMTIAQKGYLLNESKLKNASR